MLRATCYLVFYFVALAAAVLLPKYAANPEQASYVAMVVFGLVAASAWLVFLPGNKDFVALFVMSMMFYMFTWGAVSELVQPNRWYVFVLGFGLLVIRRAEAEFPKRLRPK